MGYFKSSDIKEILIDEATLTKAVSKLGKQLTADYAGKELTIVGVLKGSVMFMVDLVRQIELPLTLDFMSVSSYGGGVKTSGVVKIIKDLDRSIEGKDVLIVEDILDSGMTLDYLMSILRERKPASIKIATLLNKPERRVVDLSPDYSCFDIPDAFVVGYGLDYAEKYRNLPYVGILDPKVYEGVEDK
ncbi:MAG: hypoxanthine phosphoribosyltransferase [Angelakisella sp.]